MHTRVTARVEGTEGNAVLQVVNIGAAAHCDRTARQTGVGLKDAVQFPHKGRIRRNRVRRAKPSAVEDKAVAPESLLAGLHKTRAVHRDRIAAVKETVQGSLVNREFREGQGERAALLVLECDAERCSVRLAVGHEGHESLNGLRELILRKRQEGDKEQEAGQRVLAGFRRRRVCVSAADFHLLQGHVTLLFGRRPLPGADRRDLDF